MVFGLAELIDLIFSNILWIILFGFVAFVIWNYLRVKGSKRKVVDRCEVERLNFIERMKFNPSTTYRWLYKGYETYGNYADGLKKKGIVFLGKITHYMESYTDLIKGNPNKERVKIISLVVKPMLIKRLNISNPFKKAQVIQFEDNDEVSIKDEDKIYINETVGITNYLGIFHQIGDKEKILIDNIRQNDIRQTDINTMASVYFVKSQEQATFDPNYAHQMALAEKSLQVELAKRKGKSETL